MKNIGIQFAISVLLMLNSPIVVLAQEADDEALDDGVPPLPVVVEPSGSRELRDAMRRIAVRPNDPEALFDAGNASLMLGDAAAALNFFTRAANLRPSDGRIKAGLGAATVRTENPFEALRLFDEAVKLGISERAIAVDRALAFDLLGNFARAQQDYQLARTAAVTDQLLVQQAVSLSLSGAKTEADNMLVPLLQKNNLDAWRARAFMLAARGELKESNRVTSGFLDAASAKRMESYLRLMPQLTGAQQAAAIHFGHFPQSYQIGRDSPAVTRTAANTPQPSTGSGRLTPSGSPLGTTEPAKSNPLVKANTVPANMSRQEREAAELAAQKLEGQKTAEAMRVVQAKKQAEAAQVIEAQKKQEAARVAEQQRLTDNARIAEQQRITEAARIAEQQRIAEATRTAEEQQIAETARIAQAEKLAEADRISKFQREADSQREANSQREAENQRIAEADAARKAAATMPVFVNTPASVNSEAAKIASTTKIAEATAAKTEVAPIKELPAPENAAPLVNVALPPAQVPMVSQAPQVVQLPQVAIPPVTASVTQVVPAALPDTQPATPKSSDIPTTNMPERPAIANAPAENLGTPISQSASTQQPWTQGVDPNTGTTAPVEITSNEAAAASMPPAPAIENPTAPQIAPVSVTVPVSAQSEFDLGAVVDSIEIPKSEQERVVAVVDLDKLKKDAAKKAAANDAKAKAAEAGKKKKGDDDTDVKSAKSKSKDKVTVESPSRNWVQVATGADMRGLAFDWKRLVKKSPDLFKGRDGWTSPWGRSNRLIVGPFADLKSAKKWESEFRKAGGNGFTWVSEKGAEIERIKSK